MTEMSPARLAEVPAASDEAFGADLYGLFAAEHADAVFLPASISAALRMALCGARGQTALELAAALHLSEVSMDPSRLGHAAAAEGLRMLSTVARELAATGQISIRAANTLWVQAGTIRSGTRLVLTNAIYMKAPWAQPFPEHAYQQRTIRDG